MNENPQNNYPRLDSFFSEILNLTSSLWHKLLSNFQCRPTNPVQLFFRLIFHLEVVIHSHAVPSETPNHFNGLSQAIDFNELGIACVVFISLGLVSRFTIVISIIYIVIFHMSSNSLVITDSLNPAVALCGRFQGLDFPRRVPRALEKLHSHQSKSVVTCMRSRQCSSMSILEPRFANKSLRRHARE